MKHQLLDSMHVLHRPVEIAGEGGSSPIRLTYIRYSTERAALRLKFAGLTAQREERLHSLAGFRQRDTGIEGAR